MDNIRNLVLADEKFMGDLARGLVAGKTHEQIASEAGQSTTMTSSTPSSSINSSTISS